MMKAVAIRRKKRVLGNINGVESGLTVLRRPAFVKEMSMTKEEAINKLIECQKNDDPEREHRDADAVLCALLDDLGYCDVVAEYKKVTRWY